MNFTDLFWLSYVSADVEYLGSSEQEVKIEDVRLLYTHQWFDPEKLKEDYDKYFWSRTRHLSYIDWLKKYKGFREIRKRKVRFQ